MTATSVEKVNGTPVASHAEPRFDPLALAEAEATRERAAAEADALRIEAEGKARAEEIKAREEAERQRIINERAAMKLEREKAEHAAKIAEAQRKREESERAREKAARQAEEEQQAEAAQAEAVEKVNKRWRNVALGFYALCAAVALPVQMTAFYDKKAKYLVVAPVFIEVIALVALVGAAAAVTAGRPYWHYRLVAWAGALTAATINIVHGLDAFDAATAFGTALASVAGPGMWDLHEHGRIRKRDGKLSWSERRAQAKAAKEEAARKAAAEKRTKAEKEAREKAEAERARQLAETRARLFEDVWKHAVKLAAALGETTVTEAIWKQAHRDVRGANPSEDAETLRMRREAEARVESARTGTPVNRVAKANSPQAASQMPPTGKERVYTPPARPGRRTKGDTPKYVKAARRQAAITAKNSPKGEAQ